MGGDFLSGWQSGTGRIALQRTRTGEGALVSKEKNTGGRLRSTLRRETEFLRSGLSSMVGVVAVLVERFVDGELADPQPAARGRLGAVGVDVLDVRLLALQIQDDGVEGEGGLRRRAQPVDVVLFVRDRGVAASAGDLVDRGLDDGGEGAEDLRRFALQLVEPTGLVGGAAGHSLRPCQVSRIGPIQAARPPKSPACSKHAAAPAVYLPGRGRGRWCRWW